MTSNTKSRTQLKKVKKFLFFPISLLLPKQKNLWNMFVLCFDLMLFLLLFYVILNNLLVIVSYIIDFINNFYSLDIITSHMNPAANVPGSTNTQIVQSNDGWTQGIKSLFIYGTGAIRFNLLRAGGTPFQKAFVISSTIVADFASTALNNAINYPDYVEKHINIWNRILNGNNNSTLELNVENDNDTLSKLKDVKSNLLPDNLDADYILDSVIKYLKPIIEPVSVNYSNELLANQIYCISIILFILSIMILILLLAFIVNITILVYSDKLMNYFSNKYIRWYISLNKKLIGIEICFLGGSLLYFMYILSYGIHFIATHPIVFN